MQKSNKSKPRPKPTIAKKPIEDTQWDEALLKRPKVKTPKGLKTQILY